MPHASDLPPAQDRRATWVGCLLAALGLAFALHWWSEAQPVELPDGVATSLPCVSYAPSRHAGTERRPLSVEQIRHDLALLAGHTRCVRTYTVAEGYDQAPAVAREFGLQVLVDVDTVAATPAVTSRRTGASRRTPDYTRRVDDA